MHFLSIILTATAVSLANASALPPIDHSDLSLNPEITPALAARRFDPLSLAWVDDPLDNGKSCSIGEACKSGFCKNSRCTENQCKTDQDCNGLVCSRNNKCIANGLHDNEGCEQDNQCRSGKCGNGKCTPGMGYYSARCSSTQECSKGLVCHKAEYLGGEKICLDPKLSGSGEDEGGPCGRNEDCKQGLECQDQGTGLQKITGIFSGESRDRFKCTKPYQEQCTGLKRACFKDSDCCSKNCKTTEILFIRQCEE